MERINYTFWVLNGKGVPRHCITNHCFTSPSQAERFAEGIVQGLTLCKRDWGVIVMPDGDMSKISAKNCTPKMLEYFEQFKGKLL